MTKKKTSGAEGAVALIDGKPWYEDGATKTAFANLAPIRGAAECMLHVYYSGFDPKRPDEKPHMQRGRVTADLGFVPDPPFTTEEMHTIMFHAKSAALGVMQERARAARAQKRRTPRTRKAG